MDDKDVSKYGFYVVIAIEKDSTRNLLHDYNGCTDSAQFKSEKAAMEYINEISEYDYSKGCEYYYKYVSWSKYD